ncbi:MAG: hypothetical protein CMM87_03755 [Rickettsiales bacterium]|nr:hypothetical protein [Rickettsiales bacterium]|tara:strand:+ start:5765 stop:6160 length:396 start_codon:yes stop_codon:yes gene_type:complete
MKKENILYLLGLLTSPMLLISPQVNAMLRVQSSQEEGSPHRASTRSAAYSGHQHHNDADSLTQVTLTIQDKSKTETILDTLKKKGVTDITNLFENFYSFRVPTKDAQKVIEELKGPDVDAYIDQSVEHKMW